jgi:hypothetical protein
MVGVAVAQEDALDRKCLVAEDRTHALARVKKQTIRAIVKPV